MFAEKYEIQHEIARGGMGVVFLAKDIGLNRLVALKRVRSGALALDEDIQRFIREAQAAAALDHPHIVPVYEIGEFDGQPFYTMAYIDGPSLHTRIESGPMAMHDALRLMIQISDAVQFAHDHQVVHRDLKPHNVLLDEHGEARVTDFGLARILDGDSELTGTHQRVGTPAYMSPEQASGRAHDVGPASDLYSLGAILYCLLSGHPPHQGTTAEQTMHLVCNQDAVSLRQINPSLSRDVDTVTMKCLSKLPEHRYATVREFAEELDRCLNGQPIIARPVSQLERMIRLSRRYPRTAALSALFLLSLVLGVAFSSYFAVKFSRAAEDAVAKKEQAERFEAQWRQSALDAQEQKNIAERNAEVARDQTDLAVETLGLVVFDVHQSLEKVPGAGPMRQRILTAALERLQRIADQFATKQVADRHAMAALVQIGDLLLRVGSDKDIRVAAKPQDDSPDANADGDSDDLKNSSPPMDIAERATVMGALAIHERALAIAEARAKQAPDDIGRQRDLSTAIERVGNSQARLGRRKDAKASYTRMCEIKKRILDAAPDEALGLREYSVALAHLASVSMQTSETKQALDLYQQALKIRERLFDAFPEDTATISDLISVLNEIGDARMQLGEVDQAAKEYQRAKELGQKIAVAPSVGDPDADLQSSVALLNLAEVHLRQGDVTKALELVLQARSIRADLVRADSKNAKYLLDLSIAEGMVGEVQRKLGHPQKARVALEKCQQLQIQLVKADPTDVQAVRNLAVTRTKLGEVHESLGQSAVAMQHFEKAAASLRQLAGGDSINANAQRDLSMILILIGNHHLDASQHERASGFYEEAAEICQALIKNDPNDKRADEDLALALVKLGLIQLERHNPSEALQLIQQALEIRRRLANINQSDKKAKESLQIVLGRMGDAHLATGEPKKAIAYFEEALAIAEKLAASSSDVTDQQNLAASLTSLGRCHMHLRNPRAAQEVYRKATEVCQELAERDLSNVQAQDYWAIAATSLADASLNLGDIQGAFDLYNRAISIRKPLIEKQADSSSVTPLHGPQAKVYTKLGDLLTRIGQTKLAGDAFDQAHQLQLQIVKAFPQDRGAQIDLSASFSRLGDVAFPLRQLEKARQNYQESHRIMVELLKDKPNDEALLRNLAVAYTKLGDVLLAEQQLAEARVEFERATEILEKIAQGTDKDAGQRDWFASLLKLAMADAQLRQHKQALDTFRQALKIGQELAKRNPENALTQRDLMIVLYQLGDVEKELQLHEQAKQRYQQGIDVLDKLIQKGQLIQQVTAEKKFLQNRLDALAQLQVAIGDWEEISSKPASELVTLLPIRMAEFARMRNVNEIEKVAVKLREIGLAFTDKRSQANTFYNSACGFGLCVKITEGWNGTDRYDSTLASKLSPEQKDARQKYVASCIATLKQAIDAGWNDFQHTRNDPDLAAIQQEDSFKKLLPKEK